ncbi:hypothetical protein GCM10009582_02600 [Arthrobacter flavus]
MVDSGKLHKLSLGLGLQLKAFLGDEGLLAVFLTTHGHVLSKSHGYRTADKTGDASGKNHGSCRCRTRDSDDQGRDRDNSVIGSEYTGSQPIESAMDGVVMRFITMRAWYGRTSHARNLGLHEPVHQ